MARARDERRSPGKHALDNREKRAVLLVLPHLPPVGVTVLADKTKNKRSRTYVAVVWKSILSVVDRTKFLLQRHPLVAKAVLLSSAKNDLAAARQALDDDNQDSRDLDAVPGQPEDAEGGADADGDTPASSSLFRSWCQPLDDLTAHLRDQKTVPGTFAFALHDACRSKRNVPNSDYSVYRSAPDRKPGQLLSLAVILPLQAGMGALANTMSRLDEAYTRIDWIEDFCTRADNMEVLQAPCIMPLWHFNVALSGARTFYSGGSLRGRRGAHLKTLPQRYLSMLITCCKLNQRH